MFVLRQGLASLLSAFCFWPFGLGKKLGCANNLKFENGSPSVRWGPPKSMSLKPLQSSLLLLGIASPALEKAFEGNALFNDKEGREVSHVSFFFYFYSFIYIYIYIYKNN